MRKLLMGTWLLAMPTAYATEQDKRLADWAGSKKVFAYASALAHALDLLVIAIAYDSYVNNGFKDGLECGVDGNDKDDGTLDTNTILTTCNLFSAYSVNNINASSMSSYWQTIKTAQRLEGKARDIYVPLIQYYNSNLSWEVYNSRVACNILSNHSSLVANNYYGDFVDRYNTEHAAFKDKMRKNIIKVYFYAAKRAYGTYAAYMNRIAKRIKKEHNCEM